MIGLGHLPTLGNTSSRFHEMRLFQEVAKVDDKEAEQGALHSDVFRHNSDDKDGAGPLGRKGLAGKISRLWRNFKVKQNQTEEKTEDSCPIAKARAASTVGENAPLGWLTFDHLGDNLDSSPASPSLDSVSRERELTSSKETTRLSLKSDPDDHDYLFSEEWFLSPCG
jgi:hypothetical protein